jgi:PrcB C-terminal
MKKLTTLLLIIFIATGCCTKKGAAAVKATGGAFEILKQSDRGGRDTAGFDHITDAASLKKLYRSLSIDASAVDFKKKNVVAVYMGQKNTGGYSITIESIRVDGTTTYLKKKEIKPETGGMVSMALTAPYVIVEILKTGKVVIE